MESFKVVYEYSALAKPLSVKLAPKSLSPACIRYCEVQAVAFNAMPIFCRYIVPESIFIAVSRNLRISGCAGCKEHYHVVASASRILCSCKLAAEKIVLFVKISPAFALSVYYYLCLYLRTFCRSEVNLMRRVTVCRTQYCAYSCGIEAVFKIMLKKLICCRYGDCAELMQTEYCKPELIMSFEYEHYSVALFNSERLKIIRALCRCTL